jgi:hypothetical protein
MSENISRVKNKTKDFSIIANECFHRKDLSARAKGIFGYLMTLPNDWKINRGELFTHFSEGEGALNSAFNELMEAGYIEAEQVKDGGKFAGIEYFVYETQQTTATRFSRRGNTEDGKPRHDNCPLLKTKEPSTELLSTEEPRISSVEDMLLLKPDFTDEFKDLFSDIMETGNLKKEGLYKKNGEPKITLLRAQKMVEDLLNGDFIEKNEVVLRKTESADWIKDMTYSKILSVCKKFKPSVSVTLNNFFVLSYGNSKGRSAFIQYCNPSYGAFKLDTVQDENIPEKVKKMSLTISKRFQVADTNSLAKNLMEIYTWEEDNRKYIVLTNRGNPGMWGSFMSVMNTYNDLLAEWKDELTPNHFKLNSKTWQWVSKEVKDRYDVDWHPSPEKVKRCRYSEESRERRSE